ncbi:MAG: hypothetical protein GF388_11355, partial [Candidatus Aegiribacteria sp.]|nr:hypothetical protein [Candidatus Aegiribacteria sp.]MBD3295590.1 hypothetical protein [Candidatus Fermentibacteria bacterium]
MIIGAVIGLAVGLLVMFLIQKSVYGSRENDYEDKISSLKNDLTSL